MRTMLLITLMLAMPAAATAQDAGDADQADQRANEGASDYEAAWTVDPAAELDEETRRRRGEARVSRRTGSRRRAPVPTE